MTRASLGWLSLLVVLAMAGTGIAASLSLPNDVLLPLDWNFDGIPDRLGGKWESLLTPAGVTAMISLLLWGLPALEPLAKNLERSQGLYSTMWAGMLVVMATAHVAILGEALHWGLPTMSLAHGSLGLLFVLIGNQLGKSRRMFFTGIRTPWTLASEEVWIATHRLAGKLMVGGGMLMVLVALLPVPAKFGGTLLILVAIVSFGFPAVYSYWLWRKEKLRDA